MRSRLGGQGGRGGGARGSARGSARGRQCVVVWLWGRHRRGWVGGGVGNAVLVLDRALDQTPPVPERSRRPTCRNGADVTLDECQKWTNAML